MVCMHCGVDNAQGSKFCKQCGAVFTPDKAKGKSRGIYIMSFIAILLAIALALTFIYGKPFVIYEDPSMETTNSIGKEVTFDSAEAAIEYCVKAIADNDLNAALNAFAGDDYIRGFDFTKWCKRLNALIPNDLAPSEYGMYQEINNALITSRRASQIKGFSYSLLTNMDFSQAIIIEDEDQISRFINDVDPEKLKGLKIVRIDPPTPDRLNSEINIKNFKAQADIYGGIEGTERVVLYDLNGELYTGGFHLIRFKNGWKIESMTTYLAGNSFDGSVVKTTEEEYLQLVE